MSFMFPAFTGKKGEEWGVRQNNQILWEWPHSCAYKPQTYTKHYPCCFWGYVQMSSHVTLNNLFVKFSPTGSQQKLGFWPRLDAGTIEFKDVKFYYPFRRGCFALWCLNFKAPPVILGAELRPQIQVLKGVSFRIATGTSVGLCGPSGGGKSTAPRWATMGRDGGCVDLKKDGSFCNLATLIEGNGWIWIKPNHGLHGGNLELEAMGQHISSMGVHCFDKQWSLSERKPGQSFTWHPPKQAQGMIQQGLQLRSCACCSASMIHRRLWGPGASMYEHNMLYTVDYSTDRYSIHQYNTFSLTYNIYYTYYMKYHIDMHIWYRKWCQQFVDSLSIPIWINIVDSCHLKEGQIYIGTEQRPLKSVNIRWWRKQPLPLSSCWLTQISRETSTILVYLDEGGNH